MALGGFLCPYNYFPNTNFGPRSAGHPSEQRPLALVFSLGLVCTARDLNYTIRHKFQSAETVNHRFQCCSFIRVLCKPLPIKPP